MLRTVMERGLSLRVRAHGASMTPLIRDGDLVTIAPLTGREPRVGEVVACVLPEPERLVLHRVVERRGERWLVRGDNMRLGDGVVTAADLVGVVVSVQRDGRQVAFGTGRAAPGLAWLSRTGALRVLGLPRKAFYRAASGLRRRLQGLPAYRACGRRLGRRIEIGEATRDDMAAALAVIGRTDAGLPPHGAPIAGDQGWSAKRGGRMVAFVRLCRVDDPDGPLTGYWLSHLWVMGRYRGLGLGRALVSRAMAHAGKAQDAVGAASGSGIARDVRLAVFDDDAIARRLFGKLGFTAVSVPALDEAFAAEQQLCGRRRVVLGATLERAAVDLGAWAASPGLSHETRAVLACARAVVDETRAAEARALVDACADVERLQEAAVAHNMIGHVQRLVSEGGSGTVAATFAELQRLAAERALRQTAQLLSLLAKLDEAGITAMPYKGPAWGERFYGDFTLRTWSDLDLSVVHSQVPRAREVLLAEGFIDHDKFNERIMAKKSGGWGEIALWSTGTDIHLELHWEASVGVGSRSTRAEALLQRATTMRLLGREVLTPSKTDALLLTCLNGTKDRWASIEGLLCTVVQAQAVTAAEWPEVLAAVKRARCLRRTVVGVAHACRALDLPVPPAVAAAIARDGAARRLLRTLTPDALQRGKAADTEPRLDMLRWRVGTEDSLTAVLRHAATRFFRPGPEDWEWLALSRGAGWLYPVLRPARLAAKWAKRLVVH